LKELGYLAIGWDISQYAVCKHIRKYENMIINITDYNPNEHRKMDLIYGFNLMEHIAEIDLRDTISNLYCTLGNKSCLFLTIDSEWGLDQSHQTIRPREWWNKLFISGGFKIHEAGTEMFKGINGYVFQKGE